MRSARKPLLSVAGISKTYGPNEVLSGISFSLEPGSITGLVGENGAGKSTLIKILAGATAPTAGAVALNDVALPTTTGAVIEAGVSVIYQELTDIPDMSLLENVLLGNLASTWGVSRKRLNRERASQSLHKVGLGDLDLGTPIRELSISQRQLAEIARCLVRDAKVLILDEPTSSLPEADVNNLLTVIEGLRSEGLCILYVTHHLSELFRIADRLIILRDGRMVGDAPISEWNERLLVRTMLAKDLENAYPWVPRDLGDELLAISGLQAKGVEGGTLSIRRREIVGLVGLAGAGRTELMKAIAGVNPVKSGTITIDKRSLRPGKLGAARRQGVIYAPEDRKTEGLVLNSSISSNIAFGNYGPISKFGVLNPKVMTQRAVDFAGKYDIRFRSPQQAVGELSGGNQQKVILARINETHPKVVLFDDPTRGVDVGAKWGIYEHIFNLAANGAGILITSSDTDEVLAVSDRVFVLLGGKVVAEFKRDEFDRERILHLASVANASNED